MNIRCPHCQVALAVKPTLAGQTVACPRCHERLLVPALPPEPVLPAAVIESAAPAESAEPTDFTTGAEPSRPSRRRRPEAEKGMNKLVLIGCGIPLGFVGLIFFLGVIGAIFGDAKNDEQKSGQAAATGDTDVQGSKNTPPSEKEMIQLLANAALTSIMHEAVPDTSRPATQQEKENLVGALLNTTPDQFTARMRQFAKTLGFGNSEHSRHLLNVSPSRREKKKVPAGGGRTQDTLIIWYGPESANTCLGYAVNDNGDIALVVIRVGDDVTEVAKLIAGIASSP